MSWSLAVTAPSCEAKVSDSLRRFSYDNYLFRVKKQVVRNGQVLSLLVPAFPSYVFVAARNCWDFIRQATDVVGFVKFGGVVAEVPHADVAALAARADRNLVLPEEDPAPRFHSGQRVCVDSGVFQGFAIYDRPDRKSVV